MRVTTLLWSATAGGGEAILRSGNGGHMAEQDRELIRLHEIVIRLREENEVLRRSAGAFAELAERLSSALHEARQRADDRQDVRDTRCSPQH